MSFIINSGLKIFDVLYILNTNPNSEGEIAKKLGSLSARVDIRTVQKYLMTLKRIGFSIAFKNKKYEIIKTPFQIKLNESETKGCLLFLAVLEGLFDKNENIHSLMEKIENNIKCENINPVKLYLFYDTLDEKSFSFINLVKKHLCTGVIEIADVNYNGEFISAVIQDIKYTKNGIYLLYFDLKKRTTGYFDIKLIKLINYRTGSINEFVKKFYKTSFKIKGSLRKNYILKDGEEIFYNAGEMIVANDMEDKEKLLSRLAKYGTLVEVLYPSSDRMRFVEKLDELKEHFKSI